MNCIFNFILWDVSPEIFSIGSFSVRWYGLLFAMGFLLGQQLLIKIYRQEGKSEKHVETLTIYMVLATIIGARLGHVLFYDFEEYLKNPLEILKIWKGGLASHGAAIGILFAIYLYSKKTTGQSYFYVLDRLVITVALAGCLIRLGNLMNSEIVGKPNDKTYSFLFVNESKNVMESLGETIGGKIINDISISKNNKDSLYNYPTNDNPTNQLTIQGVDIQLKFNKNKINEEEIPPFINALKDSSNRYTSVAENIVFSKSPQVISKQNNGLFLVTIKAFAIPRLPSQLFEAISSFLLFVLLWLIYNSKKEKTPEGRIFGLFITILFSLRFIYEYQKENQVAFESGMINDLGMNMGQLLSIPFVIAGLFILVRSFRKKNSIQ